MPRVRHKSPPRRRRPRDPRIGSASHSADVAKLAAHAETQTPSARVLADASAKGDAVRTWHAARPLVIDARTGRPPAHKKTRRFATKVQVSYRRPSPPTSPPSPWQR
jgi:hypothetical protein